MLSEISRSQKGQTPYDSTSKRNLEESGPQRQGADGGRQGLGRGRESGSNGGRVSVLEDEVLETDGVTAAQQRDCAQRP